MRSKLIVNGDDFGRTEALTHGIIESFQKGILTSTTMVANGQAFDLAIKLAEENPELSVGVHLVMTEYEPVAAPDLIESIVKPNGEFYPMWTAVLRSVLGSSKKEDIRREWELQIEKIMDAGIRPSHFDGHMHCHATPSIADVVLGLSEKYHVDCVRLPAEPLTYFGPRGLFSPRRHLERFLLNHACRGPKSIWRNRLKHPSAFYGFMDGGDLSARAIEVIAARLQPGTSELMAHPGTSEDDSPYNSPYKWKNDLEALLTYSKEEFEKRFDVQLVSYREVQDARL